MFKRSEITGAVVIGADYHALGVVRSLGRRGIPVCVLTNKYFLAAMSRYTRLHFRWPQSDDQQKLDLLLGLAIKRGMDGWVLLPTDDPSVGLISVHHALLNRHFRLSTPPHQELQFLVDKRLLSELAYKLEISQPKTLIIANRSDLEFASLSYPVVLKPSKKEVPNRFTNEKAWRANDPDELFSLYERALAFCHSDQILIQELIPGWGEAQFSYAALSQSGRPLAWVVARRTRQFPMDFGLFSTSVETVNEPQIIEPSERLLASTRFTGIVEMEYKRDPRDGRFKLLDVNPRVWGWQSLCAAAGVDFAYLLWLMLQGHSVQGGQGRSGVRWSRAMIDLPVAIGEILRGRLKLTEFVRSLFMRTESSVFALDDPLPGLMEPPLLAYHLGRRLFFTKAGSLEFTRLRNTSKCNPWLKKDPGV